ncbi:unnamed protein product [Rotaria socialis]|uniref:Uncharacterized protein n=1 Tax=Rotaria socialis TaxID=392032 RepID=A0A821VA28_9BILA|nr:unnamed protein product [Rotaria socialis]CAF4902537.1 unnamed protein product [Rotaria socialis]
MRKNVSVNNLREYFEFVCAHCPIIRERYQAGDTILIYGEWCGGKVQKNVAIWGLPVMFVIIKVKIVNELTTEIASATTIHKQPRDPKTYWLDPREWATIKWHQRSIYNIFDFPTYTMEIDFNNPTVVEGPLSQIAEQVERECPVGAYFNRKGVGEGVVWTEWTKTGGNLIFKVKGRKHLVTQPKALVSATITKCANVNEFIGYACTENRMFQALDYMREQNMSIEIESLNIFLRWLAEDIIKEEKDTMNESKISIKDITQAMTNKAERFFMKNLKKRRKRNSRLKRAGKK